MWHGGTNEGCTSVGGSASVGEYGAKWGGQHGTGCKWDCGVKFKLQPVWERGTDYSAMS